MLTDDQKSEPRRVQLLKERGETSRFIDAKIDDGGNLIVSGQDVGKAPREWWGDDDYEFWLTVKSEHKDKVILALIEKLYSGNFRTVDEFRDFLESKGIPFGWMT